MKQTIRSIAFVVFALFAATGFAEGPTKHLPANIAVEMLSPSDLRTAQIPQGLVKQFVAKDIAGIPEIPAEDFPQIFVQVEGTGDVRLSGTLPVPTPLPVIVLVQRGGCPDCPFNIMTGAWTQSTVTFKPERITWYRVEPLPETLNWAYGGGVELAGTYNVKVAVLHPGYGVFMTETFEDIEVFPLEFYAYPCLNGGNVVLNLQVDSLNPIADGGTIAVDIEGLGERTATADVAPTAPRRATAAITLPFVDYAPLAGTLVPVTVRLSNGKKRQQPVMLFPVTDECGGKG